MPRRSPIGLEDVASLDTLCAAFWRAARGKASRPDVMAFAASLDASLASLRAAILDGSAPLGQFTSFRIRDPKPRHILAPCFPDRILHHALMAHMGPVLERALVPDTFACRQGLGTHAAVDRAQHHLRRFPWFVKIDIRAYFASIDHAILRSILRHRFKDPGLLALCDRILARTPDRTARGSGRGLPIGALTSQHFASTYLDAFDRHLLDQPEIRAMVRYMDDVVFFCHSRDAARRALADARAFLVSKRRLEIKPDARVARSRDGLPFLGFRVLPGLRRLSGRRRRRYTAARARWEKAYLAGSLTGPGLQAGYDAALAITAHADALAFRRAELARRPPIDA